jgi:hypothetical protein
MISSSNTKYAFFRFKKLEISSDISSQVTRFNMVKQQYKYFSFNQD